jgi:small-conductance mechanosensitive channel
MAKKPEMTLRTKAPPLPDGAAEIAQTLTAAVATAEAARTIEKERDEAHTRITLLEAQNRQLQSQLDRAKKELTLTEEDEAALRKMLADISFERSKRGAHDFYVTLRGGQVGFKHLTFKGPTLMDVIVQMRKKVSSDA